MYKSEINTQHLLFNGSNEEKMGLAGDLKFCGSSLGDIWGGKKYLTPSSGERSIGKLVPSLEGLCHWSVKHVAGETINDVKQSRRRYKGVQK